MYNKKAQSELITTVLIILLVLAAVVIVWQVVRSTVTTGAGQIEGGLDCVTLAFEIIGDPKEGEGSVLIKRNPGEGDLQKLKVLVAGDLAKGNLSVSATGLEPLETINVTLNQPINATDVGKYVEVAAVLSGDKVCEISASKKISSA